MRGFVLHATKCYPIVGPMFKEVAEYLSEVIHVCEVLQHGSVVLLVLEE